MSTTPEAMDVAGGSSAAARALECGICLEDFSATELARQPFILVSCGHSVCKTCGDSLMAVVPLRCPFDNVRSALPLIKNFGMIDLLGHGAPPVAQPAAPASLPAAWPEPPSVRIGRGRPSTDSIFSHYDAILSTPRRDRDDLARAAAGPCDKPSRTSMNPPPAHLFDPPPKTAMPAESPAPGRPRVGSIQDGPLRLLNGDLRSASFGVSDGPLRLKEPFGVAVDDRGRIIVSDGKNHNIQVFSSDGAFLNMFGGRGSENGTFYNPRGVAVDHSGRIIVADSSNHRVQIFDPSGRFIKRFSRAKLFPGDLFTPSGVAVDERSGRIVVSDTANHEIVLFTLDGLFIGNFGNFGSGSREFNNPIAVAVDSAGRIIVADIGNSRVQVFNSECRHINTITHPALLTPCGLAVDSNDFIVVSGGMSGYIGVFDSAGFEYKGVRLCDLIAGRSYPHGVAVDSTGRIVLCDAHNHRMIILEASLDHRADAPLGGHPATQPGVSEYLRSLSPGDREAIVSAMDEPPPPIPASARCQKPQLHHPFGGRYDPRDDDDLDRRYSPSALGGYRR